MNENIYFFSNSKSSDNIDFNKIGIRGKRATELLQLKMPIIPGIIINSNIASNLEEVNIMDSLNEIIKYSEKETNKKFNSVEYS